MSNEEVRALETEADYKKELEKINKELLVMKKERFALINERDDEIEKFKKKAAKDGKDRSEIEKEVKKIESKYKEEIDEYHRIESKLNDKYAKVIKEANKKGFKVRSEDVDFESRKTQIINNLTGFNERKQEVLDMLEERALETEKDYQKAYDKLKKEYNGVKAIITDNEKKCVKNREKIEELKKEYDNLNHLSDEGEKELIRLEAQMAKLQSDAKIKGFRIKE